MRHVTGLILALVFLAPGAAAAECAWVLWREEETKMPDRLASVEWAAPIAYPDRVACIAVIDANVKT